MDLYFSPLACSMATRIALYEAGHQANFLNKYLEGREFLLDHFSVADAYLATVLNWSIATPMIDFSKYPAVKAYLERMKKRPSVAKALAEEFSLYQAEMARHKAAA